MKYKEHDIVITICEIKSEEGVIPEGTKGTIVHIYDKCTHGGHRPTVNHRGLIME